MCWWRGRVPGNASELRSKDEQKQLYKMENVPGRERNMHNNVGA